MPLRALRLLPFPTSSEATLATSLSFASTLQLAAARAWSRRVLANAPTGRVHRRAVSTSVQTPVVSHEWKASAQPGPSDSKCSKYGTISGNPIANAGDRIQRVKRTEGKALRHPPRSHTKPNHPEVDVITPKLYDETQSHLRAFSVLERENLSPHSLDKVHPQHVHSMSTELPRSPIAAVPPTPENTASLHQNLLYLINVRRPMLSVPALLDYHALFPSLQSTSTYNLLIALSLRHGFYGMTQHLLRKLETADIAKNVETYKLEVRWYIGKGLWNNAWNYVQQLLSEKRLPSNEIPYSIWLEFCRTPRARRIRRHAFDQDGQYLRSYFERLDDSLEDLKKRQKLISDNRPANVPTLTNTKPFAVYCLAQLLIRTGNRDRALVLTRAYLQSLPRGMDTKNALRCLAVIHALMVSSPAKNGLPKFYEARRTLISLLKLHRLLRPNSRTLYLLLDPLRRAKKCGTVAWKTLCTFRSQWGTQVEDKRVRRRVSQLALKEGRMDVVTKMMQSEASDHRYRQRRLHEEFMADGLERGHPGWHTRFPSRDLYPKNGREARLWIRLRGKIRKVVKKRKRTRRITNVDMEHPQSAIR